MAVTVDFPQVEPEYLFDSRSVSFPALVDGEAITCLASEELLYERFGANALNPEEAKRAFYERRAELEDLARAQILLGRVPPDRVLRLTTETIALKEVTYSDAVKQSGDFPFIKRASTYLSDILGPAAVHVSANWDRVEDKERVYYRLQMHGMGFTSHAMIPQDVIHKPSQVYVWIARLWGDILQRESHRKLQELLKSERTGG
jgi:Protein of unknown function (DUF1488)